MSFLTIKNAEVCLKDCVELKKDEDLLILTDLEHMETAQIFSAIAHKMGAKTLIMDITQRIRLSKAYPQDPQYVIPTRTMDAAIRNSDVALCVCDEDYASRVHMTETFLSNKGIVRLPVIEGVLDRVDLASEDLMKTKQYADHVGKLVGGGKVRVTSETGTDLTFSVGEAESVLPVGNDFGPVPLWSEVAFAVTEGTAEGTVVVDGFLTGVGVVKEPVRWEVKKGIVTEIRGGEEAELLKKIVANADENATRIGEFGIGVSDKEIREGAREKGALGTVHFAMGDNKAYPGGTNRSNVHLDAVVYKPIIEVNGKVVFEKDKLI
jgi:leucyl aminopeptidase (aminopeptidase T)